MTVEDRLAERGLILPAAPAMPAGLSIPFAWVRVRGSSAWVSGHGALTTEGSPAGPFGKVPTEVALEDAQDSAVSAFLAILSSFRTAIGDLDRVTAWLAVHVWVNAEPGYAQTTLVANPLSELLLDLYGTDTGEHARTAIGVAATPLNLPVVVSAEIEIAP